MATAGDIVVNLTANSTQFRAGLKQGQDALQSLQSTISTVKTALIGFLSFEAVKGGINALHDQLKKIDEVGDAAEKFGVPVEFLSTLQHAAKMTDVPLESVNIGLKTMEKTLGEAGFTGSVVEGFMQVADVVAGTKGQFEQAAIATKIFKKAGVDLLPLLRQGSDGITEWGAEAEKLGILIDRDMKGKVDEADVAFKRIDASMEGLKNTIAVSLAPIFTDTLAPAILDLTQQTRAWITSAEGIETITSAWNDFAESVGFAADAISVAFTALQNFGKLAGGVAKFVNRNDSPVANIIEQLFPPIGLIADQLKRENNQPGVLEDFNAIFDQIEFKAPKAIGEKIEKFLKDVVKPKVGPGVPEKPPPEPFKLPPPKLPEVSGIKSFTGEGGAFTNAGFSAFAKAIGAPSLNVMEKQLAEAKKANAELKGIRGALEKIPAAPAVGEDL